MRGLPLLFVAAQIGIFLGGGLEDTFEGGRPPQTTHNAGPAAVQSENGELPAAAHVADPIAKRKSKIKIEGRQQNWRAPGHRQAPAALVLVPAGRPGATIGRPGWGWSVPNPGPSFCAKKP